jgi:hypothetical protein
MRQIGARVREKAQCWSVSTKSSNSLVEESTGSKRECPDEIVSLIRSDIPVSN